MPDKYVHVHHESPDDKDYRVKPSEAAGQFNVDPKTILRWTERKFLCSRRTAGGWRQISGICVETQLKGLLEENEASQAS